MKTVCHHPIVINFFVRLQERGVLTQYISLLVSSKYPVNYNEDKDSSFYKRASFHEKCLQLFVNNVLSYSRQFDSVMNQFKRASFAPYHPQLKPLLIPGLDLLATGIDDQIYELIDNLDLHNPRLSSPRLG